MYLRRRACATPSPFTRPPFENDLAADELFESAAHREAEARLKHLVELRGIGPDAQRRRSPGEVGSGKTTVCRHVAAGLHPGLHRVHYVSLTTGNVLDMYKSNRRAAQARRWSRGLPQERSRATVFRATLKLRIRLCRPRKLSVANNKNGQVDRNSRKQQ